MSKLGPLKAYRPLSRLLGLSSIQGGGGFPVLPVGAQLAILGCSIEFFQDFSGYLQATFEQLGHPFQISPYGWLPKAGDRSADWIVRLPGIVALNPDAVFVGEHVNSIGIPSGIADPLQRAKDDDTTLITQVGMLCPNTKIIFLTTTHFYDTIKNDATMHANVDAINAWRKALHGTRVGGATIVFLDTPYDISQTSVDSDCGDQSVPGGVHENIRGAWYRHGPMVAAAMRPYISTVGRLLPNQWATGVAVSGDLCTNPLLTGTTGTMSGANLPTGVVATGIGIVGSGVGPAITCSKGAGDKGQIINIVGTETNGGGGSVQINIGNISTRDRAKLYQFLARYELSHSDGVSAAVGDISNFGVTAIGNNGAGNSDYGQQSVGTRSLSPVPSPRVQGVLTPNPKGGSIDLGEAWMVSRATRMGVSNGGTRITLSWAAGPVNIKLPILEMHVKEVQSFGSAPYQQGKQYAKFDTSTYRVYAKCGVVSFANESNVFPSGGSLVSADGTPQTVPASTGNANWFIHAGDISGCASTDLDGTIETSPDGTTWTQQLASLKATSWVWNATGKGMVAGNKVRITSFALGTQMDQQIVNIV